MKDCIIYRLSNNEKVNLKDYSVQELYKLHYEEEKYSANILKSMKPFSQERVNFLNSSYDLIEKIKSYRKEMENKSNNFEEYDIQKIYIYNLFLKVKRKIKNKNSIIVLELGCGNCKLLDKISEISKLKIYGCDLHPNEDLKKENVTIYKDTIINSLNKFEDNSIDIIIADNVCEHFFIDEAETIYNVINKKLNVNGKILFDIPNSYIRTE